MLRRRRRPLVRAAGVAATTAVVAGTAGAVSHHQQQKYAQQDYENQQMYAEQAAPPPPQVVYVPTPEAAPAPQTAGSDLMAQLQQLATGIRRFIPILSWLPAYDRSWLPSTSFAGLTLWGLVVPEAMAYAGIAGLPPQAGLYTLLAALLIYAMLGTSRHLVVQATSATAALLASAVAAALVATAAANASDPATYQAYASAFVLVTGLVFLVAGWRGWASSPSSCPSR
jgi:hypothetical protein